jgi:hypothetical protein
MSTLVESLKRLYTAEKITLEKLNALLASTKIKQEEYEYITASPSI